MRDRLEYAAYAIASALVRAFPLSLVQAVVSAIGRFVWSLGGEWGRSARVNLRVAYPDLSEAERARIGRESFAHFSLNLVDLLRAEHWSDDELRQHIEPSGFEHLHAALAEGRGVLVLGAHMGNFDLASRYVGVLGIPTDSVGRALRNALLYQRVTAMRKSGGGGVIDRENAAPRIMRALRKGRMVVVLNDQYAKRSRGIFVPFFGVSCSTSPGIATIALRTGSPVVPMYVLRDAPDHHTVYALPPVEVVLTGERKLDIERATAAHNAALEAMIRTSPEQWMWGHRRFRHSSDLPPDPYGPRRPRSRRHRRPRNP